MELEQEKGWRDLPIEAKQAAWAFFKDGLFDAEQSLKEAKKKYAAVYWQQD